MKKYKMINQIYKTKLPGNAKSIMVYLINRSNEEGTCFPSVCTISEDCGISERTVQRMITVLTDKGYITKKTRFLERGGQLSNLYCIALDKEQHEQENAPDRAVKDTVKDSDSIIVPEEDATEGKAESDACAGADRNREGKTKKTPWYLEYCDSMEQIDFQFFITGEFIKQGQAHPEHRPSGRGSGYP